MRLVGSDWRVIYRFLNLKSTFSGEKSRTTYMQRTLIPIGISIYHPLAQIRQLARLVLRTIPDYPRFTFSYTEIEKASDKFAERGKR